MWFILIIPLRSRFLVRHAECLYANVFESLEDARNGLTNWNRSRDQLQYHNSFYKCEAFGDGLRTAHLRKQRAAQKGDELLAAMLVFHPSRERNLSIIVFDGSVGSITLRAHSAPATGNLLGSSRPSCTNTEA